MNKTIKTISGIAGAVFIGVVVWQCYIKLPVETSSSFDAASVQSSERYARGTVDTLSHVQAVAAKSVVMKRKQLSGKVQLPDSIGKIYEAAILDSGLALQMEVKFSCDSLPPVITVSGEFQRTVLSRIDTLVVTNTRVIIEDAPWYNTFAAGAAAAVIVCITLLTVTK